MLSLIWGPIFKILKAVFKEYKNNKRINYSNTTSIVKMIIMVIILIIMMIIITQ